VDLVSNTGDTPLHLATHGGSEVLVKTLLNAGAGELAIAMRWTDGLTPDEAAALTSGASLLLLTTDPDLVNKSEETAMLVALRQQHPDICTMLLEEGNADPDVRVAGGGTLLHHAVAKGDAALQQMLLAKEAGGCLGGGAHGSNQQISVLVPHHKQLMGGGMLSPRVPMIPNTLPEGSHPAAARVVGTTILTAAALSYTPLLNRPQPEEQQGRHSARPGSAGWLRANGLSPAGGGCR
jgi:ankyrin repeat protein